MSPPTVVLVNTPPLPAKIATSPLAAPVLITSFKSVNESDKANFAST